MKRFGLLALLPLVACVPAPQQAATQQAVQTAVLANGQLFCQIASVAGPAIVAAAMASGAPVIATGAAQNTVNAVCAAINAIPVPQPTGSVPIVATPIVSVPGAASVIPTPPATVTTNGGSQSFTFTITPVK